MQKTEHYQLNQWEKTDRIMMDDFNADNEKIDAALAEKAKLTDVAALRNEKNSEVSALNSSVAALSALVGQKARIVYGTYKGAGRSGASDPTTLDFSSTLGKAPDFLFVMPLLNTMTRPRYLLVVRGMRYADILPWEMNVYDSHFVTLAWSNTGVSWYSDYGYDYQLNDDSCTYAYVAIG